MPLIGILLVSGCSANDLCTGIFRCEKIFDRLDWLCKRQHHFPEIVNFTDRCFGSYNEADVFWGLSHQIKHNSGLFLFACREFYKVRIEIGLDDFDRNLLVWFFAAVIDSQRYDDRQEHGYSGCDPALEMAALFPCLENQQVTDQYPERAAQNAGVFVPLHQLYVMCESVAERQPREGDFTADIEVFV